MNILKHIIVYISCCLAGCAACVEIGSRFVVWYNLRGASRPSASDYSAAGMAALLFVLPEALLGLTVGWIIASLLLRGHDKNTQSVNKP